MFEDDEFDLDLSDPMLDISDTGYREQKVPHHTIGANNCKSFKEISSSSQMITSTAKIGSMRDFEREFHRNINSQRATSFINNDNVNSEAASVRRMFPGPAGVISKQLAIPGDKRVVPDDPDKDNVVGLELNNSSLENNIHFEACALWRKAMSEMTTILEHDQVTKYNTSWIKRQASANIVPYFLCKISKLDLSYKDPFVVLADKEGVIDGNLHRDVLDCYSKEIKEGSVILVVKAAVLKTVKAEYVSITMNNLMSIYCKSDVKHVKQVTSHDMQNIELDVERAAQKQHVSVSVKNKQDQQQQQKFPDKQNNFGFNNSANNVENATFSRSPVSNVSNSSSFIGKFNTSTATSITTSRVVNNPKSASSSKFTFKPMSKQIRPESVTSHAPSLSGMPSQPQPSQLTPAQSQQLVSSLLSDLDSSDIWADF